MSERVEAHQIEKVLGSASTRDGKFVLFRIREAGGNERTLAFPYAELAAIIELASIGKSQAQKNQGLLATERDAFKVSSFKFGRDIETRKAVLSLSFSQEARLDFELPADLPERLSKALQTIDGPSLTMKLDTPLN
jgi:hypothetical protein